MMFPRQRPELAPRVVVTGLGMVSALGIGWKANAAGLRIGRSAFRPVSLFDVARQRVKVAAEVDLPANPGDTQLSSRALGRLDRGGKMLLLASREAWNASGWEPGDDLPVVLGTTAGGMTLGEEYYKQAVSRPESRRGQPTRVLHYQAHTQVRAALDSLRCGGPVRIISNACASGADAIGHAWEWIRQGKAARVLAGGYEAHCQLVFAGFDSLQIMTPTTCRPFDTHRDGLLLGEGAAMMTLESLDHARRRGAVIIGEILGYGSTMDRHHLTQPHPQGDAALRSMNLACQAARVSPQDVSYINAHGTGTLLNDAAEALAINRWAGAHVSTIPVSSSKACIGHLLGAAGAAEAAVSLMALREQWLPPEPGLETPDPTCLFPIVREPQEAPLEIVLSNSFGFGGINATLVFRRWR